MADTRITLTSPGKYDMLLAISQDSVNAAIRQMWDIEGDDLEEVDYDGGIYGRIKGTISDVKIQVLADGTGRGGVYVRLEFGHGNATFADKKGKFSNNIDMKGWRFCFKADIALNDLHKAIDSDTQKLNDPNAMNEEDRNAARERLTANEAALAKFGESAGNYSIQRLFIDFTNANYSEYVKEESKMDNLPKELTTVFGICLGNWMAENKDENKSVIGYGLAMDEKKGTVKVADCLIPTHLELNTYGYKETPQSDIKMGWSGDGDRNCVVYCDMTENRKITGERLLQWSGNFTSAATVDKERRIDGSMCLRRGLFLDQYVIPMLMQYNDDMQIVPKNISFSRDGDAGDRRYHWTFDAVLGYHDEYPDWKHPYFAFRENPPATSFSRIRSDPKYGWAQAQGYDGVESTTGVSWSWEQNVNRNPPDINEDWHAGSPHWDLCDWTDHLGGSQQAFAHVDVIPMPGTNQIKIRGLTTVEVNMNGYYTRLWPKNNLDYKAKYRVAAFWQVDYTIRQENGALGCKVESSKCWVGDDESCSDDFREHAQGEAGGTQFIQSFKDSLPKMLTGKENVANAINDSLNATGRFTHPAAGSFNLYDPVFNTRGDLLASVRYNAPAKGDKLKKVKLPEQGETVKQNGPSKPSDAINIEGDVTAPIPKKGK